MVLTSDPAVPRCREQDRGRDDDQPVAHRGEIGLDLVPTEEVGRAVHARGLASASRNARAVTIRSRSASAWRCWSPETKDRSLCFGLLENRRCGERDERLPAVSRRHDASHDAIEVLEGFPSAGGMPDRVKCLHVLVGHSLAAGPGVNPLGDEAIAMLPQWWAKGPCVTPCDESPKP